MIWMPHFRIQAGTYDPALDLGQQAVEVEEQELGAREERMADLYSLLAYVWDQVGL